MTQTGSQGAALVVAGVAAMLLLLWLAALWRNRRLDRAARHLPSCAIYRFTNTKEWYRLGEEIWQNRSADGQSIEIERLLEPSPLICLTYNCNIWQG